MILNKLFFIKKLAFIFRPRVGARLQHLTLWVTINLCLPIKQEFTKIRFPVSELLSKLALQGFSSALALVSDCAASPENAFGEAPYRGDARIYLPRPMADCRPRLRRTRSDVNENIAL
jgi:hypothetical protein